MSIKYLIDKTVCYLIRRGPITPMLSAPSSHHRRVSSGEWWRDPIAIPTLVIISDQTSGPMFKWTEKHPGNVTSQSPRLIGIQKVFIDLNLLGSEFLSEETRNSKALGGNVFSEFCYLPSFADLSCPELDTSVPLSTWTHDTDTHTGAGQ